MCAIIAQFIRDLLDFVYHGNLWLYNSVYLPHQHDRIVCLSNASLAKKAGVEDGRNQ